MLRDGCDVLSNRSVLLKDMKCVGHAKGGERTRSEGRCGNGGGMEWCDLHGNWRGRYSFGTDGDRSLAC